MSIYETKKLKNKGKIIKNKCSIGFPKLFGRGGINKFLQIITI
jgi:hypothetical protein